MSESALDDQHNVAVPKKTAAWFARPRPRRADKHGVPFWKSSEKHATEPKSEEIAKLWMNENSIVNQKAAYFTAVNGALFVGLKDASNAWLCIALCWVGICVCLLAFVSISRTCAYRSWLRHALEERPDYQRFFEVDFPWFWQRLKSSCMLTAVPLAGIPAWIYLTYLRLKALPPPRVLFPCIFEICWK